MSRGPTTRRQVLAGAVAGGALIVAGCRASSTAPSGPPPRSTLLARLHPVAAVQGLIADQMVAAAKEAGASLSTQFLAPSALSSRLSSALAAGQPPDLALVGDAYPAPLAARALLVDVRDLLDQVVGLNGELFPPLRALAATGPFVDRAANDPIPIWAIPYLSLGGAWLVRQDILAKQSLPLPKSFEDARATAVRLTDPASGISGWGAGISIDEDGENLARIALLAYGARVFDALGLQVALDPNLAAAGFQAVANLYRADDGSALAPRGAIDWTTAQAADAFAAGQVAQTIDNGGLYARVIAKQPSLRGSILALPPPSGPRGWFTSAQTTFLVVPRNATNPDRATRIVQRLLRPERYSTLIQAGAGSVIPPYAYLTKGPFWDEDPNYPVFAANARGDPARNFQFANLGYPSPPTLPAALVQASNALATGLRSVATGETPASVAAASAKQEVAALAQPAITLQATPTPTPVPFWLQILGSTPTPGGG